MARQSQGLHQPKCYARALGGCCRKMSGEHYVSKSVLELVYGRAGILRKSVLVTGLAFQQRDVLQQISIGRLQAKILCENHNGLLSPFDAAGKAMFSAMDSLNNGAGNPDLPSRTLCADGDELERWMLKTLLGGLYSGNFLVTPTASMKGVCPPPEMLEILFGGAEYSNAQGLYFLPVKPGDQITADQFVFRILPLVEDADGVTGLRVWMFGFEFVLLTARLQQGVSTAFNAASFRPAGLVVIGSNTRIRFKWKGGAASEQVVFLHLK